MGKLINIYFCEYLTEFFTDSDIVEHNGKCSCKPKIYSKVVEGHKLSWEDGEFYTKAIHSKLGLIDVYYNDYYSINYALSEPYVNSDGIIVAVIYDKHKGMFLEEHEVSVGTYIGYDLCRFDEI